MTVSSRHIFVENIIAGVTKGPEVGAQTKKKWGSRRVGGRRVEPDGWRARRVGIPENGKPSISRFFFFFLAPQKIVLSSLSGGSRGIVATGRGHGPPKLCVWTSFCVSLDGPRGREKKRAKLWAVRKWGKRGGRSREKGSGEGGVRGGGGPGRGGPGREPEGEGRERGGGFGKNDPNRKISGSQTALSAQVLSEDV